MTQLFTVQTEDLIDELEARCSNSVVVFSKVDESNEPMVYCYYHGDSRLEQFGLLEFAREDLRKDMD